MKVIRELTSKDIQIIMDKINYRQEAFKDEDPLMSLGVVLMNYGDQYTKVECINREWSGTKGELTPRNGVPMCPNGHVLFELSEAPRLALVERS